MVANAIVTAVTLPPTHQYEFMSVIPTAPVGEVPKTFEAWATTLMGGDAIRSAVTCRRSRRRAR